MQIIRTNEVTPQFVQEHPDYLYVFEDNYLRRGLGGQAAVMRNAPMSVGICLKWQPDNKHEAFFYDEDYDKCVSVIDRDFKILKEQWELWDYPPVLLPYGIGTGLARLQFNAPRVLEYLIKRINGLLIHKVYA